MLSTLCPLLRTPPRDRAAWFGVDSFNIGDRRSSANFIATVPSNPVRSLSDGLEAGLARGI